MIVVRRTYIPRPGGGSLVEHLKDVNKASVEAGLPPLTIQRKVLGLHGTMVTDQRWPSIMAYEESREKVRQIRSITEIFERIYPVLASAHETELYQIVE